MNIVWKLMTSALWLVLCAAVGGGKKQREERSFWKITGRNSN